MNIYQFLESKGWKASGNGGWYKDNFHPHQNEWTFDMVIEDLKKEGWEIR